TETRTPNSSRASAGTRSKGSSVPSRTRHSCTRGEKVLRATSPIRLSRGKKPRPAGQADTIRTTQVDGFIPAQHHAPGWLAARLHPRAALPAERLGVDHGVFHLLGQET